MDIVEKIERLLSEGRVDQLSVRSKKADRVWFGDEETGVIKGMVKNMARQGDYIVATVLDNMGEYHEVEFLDPMPPDPWDERTDTGE